MKMKIKVCQGVSGIIIVTMVTGFLLVYNSSSGDRSASSSSSSSSSSSYRLDARVQSTKAPDRSQRLQTTSLEGYSGVMDHKLLKMHCRTCALVTSSGQLTASKRGEEIDRSECVIRMNDAPSLGHQQDVGRRTSLRVIAHSSLQRVLRSRQELLNMSQDTVFIFWGPSSCMRRDGKGHVYDNLKLLNQLLPKLKIYIISRIKMLKFDELFKKETGIDRSSSHPTVPYHYYEPSGPSECSMYLSHERNRRGSHHRFITEKAVFANWARTRDIHFYQPNWKPSPIVTTVNGSYTANPAGS
ncbi:alpha-N-acetylgalactosaminide alpha-2,6-sialyltransferase 5b isoform X2 [Oreochromis aureus]|uniref:alpha-N-acetylgalactosaminide alpha-2,6-sialyltransferase 5b isoform X2 n=1 Tax=Oreochromis aureus TaxID=47969 RepID=UPI001952D998|nr:alpha-N-acetylgalactosaminide alpha-2,6-sialyltransferase 5b isoform X2 [Oreochromis aureus]